MPFMTRLLLLTSLWLAGLTLCLRTVAHAAEPMQQHPNVLLICVDDLKPVLGCYGDAAAKTPNIDSLASRGVLFEAAYCNQAVCSPSRNALMTGLRPQTLGIYDLDTHFRFGAPDAVTVAEYFRQNGYHTQAMGKILHTGHGNQEDAASWTTPHWRPKASQYHLESSTASRRVNKNGPRGTATESADVPDNAYADGMIADEAVARIQKAAMADEPFFIAVGFLKPHLPFVAPGRYWDLYDPDKLPMPQVTQAPMGAPPYAAQYGGELRQYSDMPATGDISPQDTRHLIHGYYAATSYVDAQIGRVIDALNQTGIADNTIIVLWGDHGWHLGDHGMWCKHTNYEQAARIPVIVAAPDCKTGVTTRALIETVDIYPTLCELAGLPSKEGLDGTSFSSILKAPETQIRDSVIHVYPRSGRLGRAIRTERYRMVEWKTPGQDISSAEYELYDYQTDALETVNIADQQPDVLKKLKAILASHPEARAQISNQKAAPAGSKASSQKDGNKKSGSSLDRVAMFQKRDKDNDGKLSRDEFLANQPDGEEAATRFPRFDKNKDGVLSQIEFVSGGKQTDSE